MNVEVITKAVLEYHTTGEGLRMLYDRMENEEHPHEVITRRTETGVHVVRLVCETKDTPYFKYLITKLYR